MYPLVGWSYTRLLAGHVVECLLAGHVVDCLLAGHVPDEVMLNVLGCRLTY